MTRRSRLDIRSSLLADGGVPSDSELASWPAVDVLALAPERRELYLRRDTDAAHRIDITAFAHEPGESSDAFRWPTLGALPFWLRQAVASPEPRICLACLSAGYHAALFSIRLLDVCPIHGTPLVSRCHCGAPFSQVRSQHQSRHWPHLDGVSGATRCLTA